MKNYNICEIKMFGKQHANECLNSMLIGGGLPPDILVLVLSAKNGAVSKTAYIKIAKCTLQPSTIAALLSSGCKTLVLQSATLQHVHAILM